jgi:hypothetical protein
MQSTARMLLFEDSDSIGFKIGIYGLVQFHIRMNDVQRYSRFAKFCEESLRCSLTLAPFVISLPSLQLTHAYNNYSAA